MDVTRRSFGAIAAGAIGSLFLPRGVRAQPQGMGVQPGADDPKSITPPAPTRLEGRISRTPTFKSFRRKDGSTGFRHFMVLARGGRFLPVVSWEDTAIDLHYDYAVRPGAMIEVEGNLVVGKAERFGDWLHFVCSKYKVLKS